MKFWQSSADADNLALTVKGALTALIPLAVIAAQYYHINTDAGQFTGIVEAIQNAIVAVGSAISAVMVVVGIARKVYYFFKNRTIYNA